MGGVGAKPGCTILLRSAATPRHASITTQIAILMRRTAQTLLSSRSFDVSLISWMMFGLFAFMGGASAGFLRNQRLQSFEVSRLRISGFESLKLVGSISEIVATGPPV